MNILDIGSGTSNSRHKFFVHPNAIHVDISRKAFHLEVQCDAHFLPFQDGSFDCVQASHILEHLRNPFQAISEIRRVARKVAIIKIPNASCDRLYHPSSDHIYGWTQYNFENLLRMFFSHVEIQESFRVVINPKTNPLKQKWKSFLMYINALLCAKNEIIAVCHKDLNY